MAQDNFINATASSNSDTNGVFRHSLSHGSSSAGDATFSWDHTKFTTKAPLISFLKSCEQFINSRGDLK